MSFFYSARNNSNEEFYFSVGNLAAVINDHVVGSWRQFNGSFVGDQHVEHDHVYVREQRDPGQLPRRRRRQFAGA